MARYTGPKLKLSRREGTDLFLKSSRRAFDSKAKADSKPGQHGRISGARQSDYGTQLREKQKVKRMYGMLERQFRRYYQEAVAPQGQHRRAPDHAAGIAARQRRLPHGLRCRRAPKRASWWAHRAIALNGETAGIPSMLVKPGDIIAVREKAKKQGRIQEALSLAEQSRLPIVGRCRLRRRWKASSRAAPDRRRSPRTSTSRSSSSCIRDNVFGDAGPLRRSGDESRFGRLLSSSQP